MRRRGRQGRRHWWRPARSPLTGRSRPRQQPICVGSSGRRGRPPAISRELAARLPLSAAWLLEGVEAPADLWQVEGRWWRRLDRDAAATLRAGRTGPAAVAAAAATLVSDAWRTQAALEAAAWGLTGLEAFDAVA